MCRCAGSGRYAGMHRGVCVGVLIMAMYRVDDRGLCIGLIGRRASVRL